jgi:hypothetical protein
LQKNKEAIDKESISPWEVIPVIPILVGIEALGETEETPEYCRKTAQLIANKDY